MHYCGSISIKNNYLLVWDSNSQTKSNRRKVSHSTYIKELYFMTESMNHNLLMEFTGCTSCCSQIDSVLPKYINHCRNSLLTIHQRAFCIFLLFLLLSKNGFLCNKRNRRIKFFCLVNSPLELLNNSIVCIQHLIRYIHILHQYWSKFALLLVLNMILDCRISSPSD